jgi:hypothetical protein
MKVRFRQSGGFAGLVRGCELSSDELAPADGAELVRLVQAAGLAGIVASPSGGADRQGYEIAVEGNGAPKGEYRLTDSDLTDEIAALVAFLRARSKPQRPT